jgi:hypothetical protein
MSRYFIEIIRGVAICTNKPYLMPYQILLEIINNKNRVYYSRKIISTTESFERAVEIYKENIHTCRTVKCNNKIIADLIYMGKATTDEYIKNYELVKQGVFQPLFADVSVIDGYVISSNGRLVKYSDARKFMSDELLDTMENEFEFNSEQEFYTEYENCYRRKYKSEYAEDYELELEIFKN